MLAATPILTISNDAFVQHVLGISAAIMLASTAMGPQVEITTAAQVLKRFSFAVLFPVAWMVLQIVPLPFASIVNTIWPTASVALREPSLWGHISLDPGATLRSLISYLTILSLAVATVIITKDRQRSETTLYVLSVVTTFMCIEVLLGQFHAFAGIIPLASVSTANTFAAIAALATLINVAIIVMGYERHLTRTPASSWLSGAMLFGLVWGLCGIAISLAAMRSLAYSGLVAATGLGFATILFIAVVRRLGLRPWPSVALFTILAAMASFVAITHFQTTPSSGLLGFIDGASSDAKLTSQRALSDASLVGSGVGTFESLTRIYRTFDATPIIYPPSAAILIAIEWGRPAFLILVGIAFQLFFFIFFGAMRRGRDSFYPSLAAAVVLLLLCEAFRDPSLLSIPVQIITAVSIGLGLAQSTGRTSGSEN